MADEFQFGTGNWWDSSRNRFDTSSSPSSTTPNNIVNFGWPTEPTDTKPTPCVDSVSVSASSIVQGTDSTTDGVLTDPNLQMMGLGLSSQGLNWNQELIRNEKAEGSFQTILQDDMSSNTSVHQQQEHWREKIYSSNNSEDSSMNRGFSLDRQPEFSSHLTSPSDGSTVTCQQTIPTNFQMDSAVYGNPSTMLLGLLESENQQNQSIFENRPINYQYPSGFGMNNMGESIPLPSWSKFPQFLRNSPQNQPPHSQLHFSNNAPFWNASAASMNDARASFFPSLQMQLPSSSFDEKPKNLSENRDLSTVGKKSGNDHEQSIKRPRNETAPSPLPAFKVRKEKMGDRITALQQLVSPFGKTDTASVLSEAIEYIKFLHEQVSILSSPYMKSGAPVQHHQQISEKSKDLEGPKLDLKSRGLCLVPVSSTFPVTHETTVDFWTPTFGGTFR